jgi:ATP-binding cassette subfamily A (ABC1) protein 3
MLSGEIKPTKGNAWIAGYDIINNMAEARRNIGYCP